LPDSGNECDVFARNRRGSQGIRGRPR
jgi:hypothetical protein